jgi:hypothetical protein
MDVAGLLPRSAARRWCCAEGDARVPFAGGAWFASSIAGAEFVGMQSSVKTPAGVETVQRARSLRS